MLTNSTSDANFCKHGKVNKVLTKQNVMFLYFQKVNIKRWFQPKFQVSWKWTTVTREILDEKDLDQLERE